GSSAADFNGAWSTAASADVFVSLLDDTPSQIMVNFSNSPSATSEILQLLDGSSTLVDEVNYDDSGAWPGDDGSAAIQLNIAPGDLTATPPGPNRNGQNLNDAGSNWILHSSGTDAAITAAASGVWNSGSDVGSPGIYAPSTPLPVELISFEALAGPDSIELSWSTATETNNAGFAVETSRGGDWQEIAWVNGFGTTLEAQNYRHTVVNLAPGRHQFRLRQVDFDGAFEYSPVVEATISVPGTHALSEAYPNPFNPQARFELTVATEQAVTVTLHDALGRTVRTLYTGVVAANATQSVLIDGSELPSGLYVYRAAGERFAESRTVLLVK
ncbi:MAG: T9SS type A sorting domain-containing protein, partial [Bacteroidota bacterium]